METRFLVYYIILVLFCVITENCYACGNYEPCPIPDSPSVSSPVSGSTCVSTDGITLDWNGVECDKYYVFLSWESGYPGSKYEICETTNTSCFTGPLLPGKTYYWIVAAFNNCIAFSIPIIRTFTTEPGQASNPDPCDGANDVDVDTNLSWMTGPGVVSQGVYFGPNSPGDFQGSQTETIFNPGVLDCDTTYYWRIKGGCNTFGPIWSFTTKAVCDTDPPAAPNNLIATSLDSRVDLDWADNNEADLASYNVYRSMLWGGPYGLVDSTSGSDYSDYTVTNGDIYFYVVTAVDTSNNESANSNETSAIPRDTVPPQAPTNLIATSDEGSVILTWYENTEADLSCYNVYRSTNPGGPYNQIAGGLIPNSYIDDGVINGTTYYYIVKAVDTSMNTSPPSNESSATPFDTIPPAAPTGLHAIGGDGMVLLDWFDNSEPDLIGYNVYRNTAPSFPSTPGYRIATQITQSEYMDDTVINGQIYYYKVKALDTSLNRSAPSSEVSATPEGPPEVPTNLTVSAVGSGRMDLQWTDQADDENGFKVERKISGGSYEHIATLGVAVDTNSVVSYSDMGLDSSTTYTYRVYAYNSNGDSVMSNEAWDTTAPAVPTNLTAVAVSTSQIDLHWVDNSVNEDGFKIERKSDGGSWEQITSVGVDVKSYNDPGLDSSKSYSYRVCSYNTEGDSDWSNEHSNSPIPVAPSNLIATIGGSVGLNWDDTTELDFASYNVYRETVSGFTPSFLNRIVAGLTVSEYVDSDVTNGPTYYYVVTTKDSSSNESGPSNEDSAQLVDRVYNKASGTWHYSIQDAIDKAVHGDTIEVSQDTYIENISLNARNITLTSADPENPAVVAATIINGGNTGNVVKFGSGDNSKLKGFTIKNSGSAGSDKSGIYCNSSSPVISNCVIESNFYGILCESGFPDIENCIIKNNSYDDSIGITAPAAGSGTPTIRNTLIHSISGTNSSGIDIGSNRTAVIRNTTIANNAKGFNCSAGATPTVTNCIVYSNTSNSDWASSDVTYTCRQADLGGEGNISVNPGLEASYHLTSGSVCINAGKPDFVSEAEGTDLDGKRRVLAARIDMGAYEYGKVIYVNDDAPGPTHDGSTWDSAYLYLKEALSVAVAGEEVWVAAGTYYPDEDTTNPDGTDNRNTTFQLVGKVSIYGGFAADEDSLNERDWTFNKTVLSGDIDDDDIDLPDGENSYHVVAGAEGAFVDGFVITRGIADSAGGFGGGGMLNDSVLTVVRNSIFYSNMAGSSQHGGGIYNRNGSNSVLINCIFSGNKTTGNGGAVYNDSSDLTLINCTITNNYAESTAGGMYNVSSNPTLTNCILWDNEDSGGIDNLDAQIYGGSPVVSYSCIRGWSGGVGNINISPQFVNTGHWDATVAPNSIELEVTVRDFIVSQTEENDYPGYSAHPDFQSTVSGVEEGIVKDDLDPAGEPIDNKPDFTDDPAGLVSVTNVTNFDKWYNDDPSYNKSTPLQLELVHKGNGIYEFRDPWFFPIDDHLFGSYHLSATPDGDGKYHNFHFTLELHTTFTYYGTGEYFRIYQSDDDMFLFINKKLTLDIGGIHRPAKRYLEIEDRDGYGGDVYLYKVDENGDPLESHYAYFDLDLQPNVTYAFDLFFAERHTDLSHFEFSTTIELKTNFTPGDYHLQAGSSCIDAGNNDAVPSNVETDIEGVPRFVDDANTVDTGAPPNDAPYVDIGAYECRFQIAPVASDDSYNLYNDETLTIDASSGVLTNDIDGNDDELTAELVSGVSYGSLTFNSDGSFEYTPGADFVGDDIFTYRAYDGQNYSEEATVTITVYRPLSINLVNTITIIWPINEIQQTVHLSDVNVTGGNSTLLTTLWTAHALPPTGYISGYTPDATYLNPIVTLQLDPNIFVHHTELDFLLKLVADDRTRTAEKCLLIEAKPEGGGNCAPEVDAGGPYSIDYVNSPLNLDGDVKDDGLPFNGNLFIGWESNNYCPPSGAEQYFEIVGEVKFADEYSEDTTATFTQPGTYHLLLTASDGQKTTVDTAVVYVGGIGNQVPEIDAGTGQNITPPDDELWPSFRLDSSVTDDGLLISPPEIDWQPVIQPDVGTVTFDDTKAEKPVVTFTESGTYVLQLEVSDGQYTVFDYVEIIANEPPFADEFDVYAGEDQEIKLPNFAQLEGEITPLEIDAYVTKKWRKKSGPGKVEFTDDAIVNPQASFSEPGEYVLELKGRYATVEESNDVMIDVKPGIQISAGWHHTLLIDDTDFKSVWACGQDGSSYYGYKGALGIGDYGYDHYETIPVRVHPGEQDSLDYLRDITAVSAGCMHSLALDMNNKVWAWGDNYFGQLGNGQAVDETTPVRVTGGGQNGGFLERIVDISAGLYKPHSLAVESNGDVWAWGSDYYGQLGNGNNVSTPVPMQVHSGEQDPSYDIDNNPTTLKNIVAVSGGENYSMALEKLDETDPNCNGRVYTWGSQNTFELGGISYRRGRLGDPDTYESVHYPVKVHSGEQGLDTYLINIVAISACSDHSMALEKLDETDPDCNGRVYTWGYNGPECDTKGGRLGDPNTNPDPNSSTPKSDELSYSNTPVLVHSGEQELNQYLINIIDISAGLSHSMALDKEGNVWAWGDNTFGELGNGKNEEDYEPESSRELTPVKIVAPDRDEDTFPDDLNGDEDYTNDFLGDDIPIIAISAGYWHSLAMDEMGNIYSWGYNEEGQLGIGSKENKKIPQLMPPLGARVKNLNKSPGERSWYSTIQEAIDDASDNDTLVAYPGTYSRIVIGKNIILRSLDPNDLSIVSNTIINGVSSTDYDVVTFSSNNTSTLSGFTITNGRRGIDCTTSSSPTIINNIIHNNQQYGIRCRQTNTPIIKNNLIFGNALSGIKLNNASAIALIRNNTIVDNRHGIHFEGENQPPQPKVRNCIVWGNVDGDFYNTKSIVFNDVRYCASSGGYDGEGNIDVNESIFVSTDPADYYRLKSDSTYINPCIDAGEPNAEPPYTGESDIDGQIRVMGQRVDIGADEFSIYFVEAGEVKITTTTESVDMNDSDILYNHHFPPGPTLSVLWSVLKGPDGWDGNEPFDNNSFLHPTATFDTVGEYKLRLEVFEDGHLVGMDTVVIIVVYGVEVTSDQEEIELPYYDTVNLTAAVIGSGPDYSLEWIGPYEPEVVFGSPDQNQTTATFSWPEDYVIDVLVTDNSTGSLIGIGTIDIVVGYSPVEVNAGQDQEITLPDNSVYLAGSVRGSGIASVLWAASEEATDLVRFSTRSLLDTWAEFDEPGIYDIALFALDGRGNFRDIDIVTITVNRQSYGHIIVNAGEDRTIILPQNFVFLDGYVEINDVNYTTEWISNVPTVVHFDDSSLLQTYATFDEAGIFDISLILKDSIGVPLASSTITVTVRYEQVIIEAGEDQTINLIDGMAAVNLAGEVICGTYDSVQWIDTSGGLVTFEDCNQLETTAIFTQGGEYRLGLVAKDTSDDILTFDTVTVVVNYQEVTIYAGENQEITGFPLRNEAALHGLIIEGDPEETEWIYNGPAGLVKFGDVFSLYTWAEFEEPGIYQLGLVARDGGVEVGWDVVSIDILPDNNDIVAEVTGSSQVTLVGGTATVHLTGIVVSGTYFTIEWRFTGPAGLLSIADLGGTNPYFADVTFFEPGNYDIGFLVKNSDNQVIGFGKAAVTVNPEIHRSLTVQANAVPEDITLPETDTTTLSVTVFGNGSYDYWQWIDPSGLVTFSQANGTAPVADVTATFTNAGVYDLGILLRNGGATGDIVGLDKVTVPVRCETCRYIEVDAGQDQEVMLPFSGGVEVDLHGQITGNIPYNSAKWLDPSDGFVEFGQVEFDYGQEIITTATFTEPGIYHLGLLVEDSNGVRIVADNVAITVNSYDTKQSLYVDAGDSQTITYLVDEYVNLAGTVKGSGQYDRVEWRTWTPDVVTIENADDPNTRVFFELPGTFKLGFFALLDNMEVVWDTVEITVEIPEVIITAKAYCTECNDGAGRWISEEYNKLYNGSPVTISLMGELLGANPASFTYQWLTNAPSELMTIDDVNSQTTDVTIYWPNPGIGIALDVFYDSNFVARETICLIVLPGEPVVDINCGYYEVKPGETLHIDQVFLWDNNDINEANIVWSSDPLSGVSFDYNAPYSKEKPGVTFQNIGLFTLTLAYTDDLNQTDSDSTYVYVATEVGEPYVFAGAPRTTVPYREILIDDAIITPVLNDLYYEWTVEPEEGVLYFKSSSDRNIYPLIMFSEPGTYAVTLTVTVIKTGELFGQSEVTFTVQPYQFQDDEAPEITLFEAEAGGQDVDGMLDVHGDIDIVVEAKDENIDYIELKVRDNGSREQVISADNYLLLEGTAEKPFKLRLTHTLDTYYSGDVILEAIVFDKAGDYAVASKSFSSIHTIASFAVTPETVSDIGDTLEFDASLNFSQSWTLEIPTVYSTGGDGNTVSIIGQLPDFNVMSDGSYQAILTAGSDQAKVSFNVAANMTQDNLKAEIIETDFEVDMYKVPTKVRPTITEGLYNNLEGFAYHSVFPDDVYYKIEVYEVDVERPGRFDTYDWDPTYFVKNVTPGPRDENGFRNASVGSGSTAESFGTLDFSTIKNGSYRLLLTVKCHGLVKHDDVLIVLDCPLKVGNVKFSQEDTVIPVGGFPIRVVRSYDSLSRNNAGDFGYGWTYSFADMDIKLNETRVDVYDYGSSNIVNIRCGGDFDRDVTLTLPDGTRATFVPRFQPCDGLGQANWMVMYDAPEGVEAKLTPEPACMLVYGGPYVGKYWIIGGSDLFRPSVTGMAVNLSLHDFPGFVLETSDGTKYHIKRNTYGLQTVSGLGDNYFRFESFGKPYLDFIETANDEKIVFDYGGSSNPEGMKPIGIQHLRPDGLGSYETIGSIDIYRDPTTGYITSIKAPGDNPAYPSLMYEYDDYGNLVKVSKLVYEDDPDNPGNPRYEHTTYVYSDELHPPVDHYITAIQDSRGLYPIRYIYDYSGRLQKVIDAKGNEIEIKHDIIGNTETVTDRSDNVTIYEYNTRGNVISVTNAKSQTTTYEYNDSRNPDKPTAINVPMDAGFSTTQYEYDSRGRTIKVIDPELNETHNHYDSSGNLIASWHLVPNPDNPTEDVAVVTVNSYDEDNMLTLTRIFMDVQDDYTNGYQNKDIFSYIKHIEQTEYDYDGKNRLEEIHKVDPQQVLATVVTRYVYNEGLSNSPDQPYQISEPFNLGEEPNYIQHFYYDDKGNQTESWYEWDDLQTSGVNPDLYVFTVTEYDEEGRVVRTRRLIDDENPYNENDLVSELVLSQTTYNDIGKPDTVEGQHLPDEYGILTLYDYDELGNLVETSTYKPVFVTDHWDFQLLTTTQNLYDNESRMLVTVGPYDPCDPNLPAGTETVYDSLGRAVETRRWAGIQISLVDLVVDDVIVGKTVNPVATVANAWDGTGSQPTNIGWTANDGLLPIAGHPTQGELSYSRTIYDTAGRVSKIYQQDETGIEHCINEYIYDTAGKQTLVKTLPGTTDETITETHYEGTRRDWVKDARENTTSFDYDTLGRVIKTTFPATAQNPVTYVHIDYDGLGRKTFESKQTAEEDPNYAIGKVFEYDSAGRATAVILPEVEDPEDSNNMKNPAYDYEYDNHGNLISITDAKGRQTQFTYNELNRLTSRTLPLGQKEIKEYDEYGRINYAEDFEGQVAIFDYNQKGLLEYARYYNSKAEYLANYPENAEPNIQYNYDNLGRRISVLIDGDEYGYQYDVENRVTLLTSPQGEIAYSYNDITGRRQFVRTPADGSDTEVKYAYDALGRLSVVTVQKYNGVATNEIFDYGYNEVGALDWICYPNGGCTVYNYDSLNRLTELTNENSLSEVLSSFVYGLADDGQRELVTETFAGQQTNITWGYDDLNRLLSETYDAPGTSDDYSQSYTYDLVGNRIIDTLDGNDIYYHYNTNDQLLKETSDPAGTNILVQYQYDDNGSLTQADNGTVNTYTYNLQNRLDSVTVGSNPTITYKYNPDGIRIEKKIGSLEPINYLIDPYNHTGYSQVLKEVKTGTDPVVYIVGSDVYAQAVGSANPVYLLYDGHGSVRQMADSSGALITGQTFHYDAYGNIINSVTPATSLLYSGEWRDFDSGLDNLRSRWYNYPTGTLNQIDYYRGNKVDPQSLHKYLYCHSNPVNMTDPSGRFSLSETISVVSIRMIAFNTWAGGYVRSAKPFVKTFMGLTVAHDIYQGIEAGATVSALTIGSGGNVKMPLELGFAGGAEVAIGRNSGEVAAFGFGGPTTNSHFGASLLNIGLAFNTASSQRYEGRGRAVTFSLSLIPSNVRQKMLNNLQVFLPKLHSAFLRRQNELAGAIPSEMVTRFSNALTSFTAKTFSDDASVTLWGAAGNSFGFSLSPGYSTFGPSDKVTASYIFYEQIAPEEDGRDIEVPF